MDEFPFSVASSVIPTCPWKKMNDLMMRRLNELQLRLKTAAQLSISDVRQTSLIREERVLSRVLNPEPGLSMQSSHSRNRCVCAVRLGAYGWSIKTSMKTENI